MGLLSRKNNKTNGHAQSPNMWARPEMQVTFRAEIMPGRDREERTFRIKEVHRNGRVTLYDFIGEHRQGAFEPINFLRDKARNSHKS
jgi:hypothetical protein